MSNRLSNDIIFSSAGRTFHKGSSNAVSVYVFGC